eukprot:m.57165 g.57165  ORF g.57165 m.57165 type:complete len:589 (-) comp13056_c0_seq1:244-2010(-)
MDKTSRMKECSAGTSASHLSPPALRLLFLLLLVFSACTRTAAQGSAGTKAAAVTCAQNTTVDPASITRIGSDYKWLAFSSSATIQDCINACCAEVECQAFSYNTAQHVCTSAPGNASKCCALKSGIPPAQQSHFTPGEVTTGYKYEPPVGIPTPSQEQQDYMDMGLTQFMHFSVTTFGNIEHDCVNGACLPASEFNPTNMGPDEQNITATDQWAMTAVAMGAGEICLTAHHEGGFCLWPSQYSNYTVMQSPYKHDIVKDFIASCKKYGIRPCFYIGPNANGYFTQVLNYTATEFVEKQLGMIREVLTEYGPISRLWWDHYLDSCGGLSECPACTDSSDPNCFPAAWQNFTELVRAIAPNTLLGTGPDVAHSGGGETGVGDYPVWNAANSTQSPSFGPFGRIFFPREADATIQNPGDAWFWKKDHAYWNASQIWQHYLLTVGRGENFILNLPPDTTGRIPQEYVNEAALFGNALRQTFNNPYGVQGAMTSYCSVPLIVILNSTVAIDTVETREDLSQGQTIASYAIDVRDIHTNEWVSQPVNGQTVGNRVIDVFPTPTVTDSIRFRCLSAVEEKIHIRSIKVFKSAPPP